MSVNLYSKNSKMRMLPQRTKNGMVIAFSVLVVVIKIQVGKLKMRRLVFDENWRKLWRIVQLAPWCYVALC